MTVIAMVSFVVDAERTKRAMAIRALERLPLAVPLISGHLACLGIFAGWLTRDDFWLVVSVCGLIGSIGSAIAVWTKCSVVHSWHVSLQAGFFFVLAVLQEGSFAWLAMAGLVVAAIALMRIKDGVHSRGLSWLVVLGGIYLILFGTLNLPGESLTWLMLWTGASGMLGLWGSPRRSQKDLDPSQYTSRALWRGSLWLTIGSVVLTCITVATIFDAETKLQWMIASLSSMSVIAVVSWITHTRPNERALANRRRDQSILGVVSMVWHAGQAIDAVWPWWVFGITTGLILLSILAGIEKHRDQLQRWSSRLATWE